ncbi:MAG TPA: hypothetical protein VG871_00380, partial [Vicinamibacterales bacterium]|nr:hypothetical protein [Vicinamibacterales bacterium]
MNIKDIRRHEMLTRVSQFGTNYRDRFPAASVGGRSFAAVAAAVDDVAAHAQGDLRGHARAATGAKRRAREALRKKLLVIVRTARALAIDRADLAQIFRMPAAEGDLALLTAAQAMADAAADLADAFCAHGLRTAFRTDLLRAMHAFEEALHGQDTSRTNRADLARAIAAGLDAGFIAVRRLDAIVPNVLG